VNGLAGATALIVISVMGLTVAARAFERIARGAVGMHALQRQFLKQLADLPDFRRRLPISSRDDNA